ncbi:cytochrome P450 [Podospora australis]|uniref:Cytochrome P450 n=1 Tax=Podospora australis TaxID=1536484 RepID=A0AAN6WWG0_9PEZI|nr:cytochrome P450 [Podospora australis]
MAAACFDRHINNFLNTIPADGETFDAQSKCMDMTMDSSTDFLLGCSTNNLVKPSPESRPITADFEFSARESAYRARLGSLLYFLPHGERDRSVKRLREYVRSYMNRAAEEKAKAAGGPEDAKERGYVFLDELLKQNPSEEYTIDTILSILLAGRDTTAAALTALFYFLARSPEVVEKLREEIAEAGAESPSFDTLKNMKYLNNIVKEGVVPIPANMFGAALRLFPPISTNSRMTNKETILPRGGGPDGKLPILVPKGTSVRFSSCALQRSQEVYGPDADEFRPERWESSLRAGWSYIPFSGGPRICIGQQFALTQVLYTLYKFFGEFQSIEARDPMPLGVRSSLSSSFANGCLISVKRARGK